MTYITYPKTFEAAVVDAYLKSVSENIGQNADRSQSLRYPLEVLVRKCVDRPDLHVGLLCLFNVNVAELETSLQGFINASFENITSTEQALSLLKQFESILQVCLVHAVYVCA